jgi:hydrogenase nickel incorporation protein HypA/HybF
MHELSLANRLVQVAEESAREAGAARVTAVTLRVGDLSGVSVEALRFAYDVAAAGTMLEGSRLEVRTVAVTVYCPRCERVAELASVQNFRCPACDTPTGDVRAGRELEIESLEVE